MHRELIHALRVNIHASRINIHALREDFIPCRKFMHREKISYLAEMYASQEDFIPCEIHASLEIHASREDFIPRRRSCIESQFMHH